VTKKNIVRTISEELGLTQHETRQIVQKTFDAIVRILAEERRVEPRNFGVFEVRWRKSRKARNPRTGETVVVPEKCTVTFKPGQVMQERIKDEGRDDTEVRLSAALAPLNRSPTH
jgi:integration host factor subunit beta